MSTDEIYVDILTELKESVVHCNLEEEQRFVRKAHDKLWRRILKQIIETLYSNTNDFIYSSFMPKVEKQRQRGKKFLGTSLVTCPEKRCPSFHYPHHFLCLDDFVWEIFHNQVRSENSEARSTVLLMCVEFTNGERICRVERNVYLHAEVYALRFLETSIYIPKKIDMYISRSPCIECLSEIQNFFNKNKNTIEILRIRFSSIHGHYLSQQMERLRELSADIGVFNDDDWNHLEKHLTDEAYYRLMQKFGKMDCDQEEQHNAEIDDYDDDGNNKNDGCDDIITKNIMKIHPISNYYRRDDDKIKMAENIDPMKMRGIK